MPHRGFALEQQAAESMTSGPQPIDKAFRATYPTLTHLAGNVLPGSTAGHFAAGLKFVLDGIEPRLATGDPAS